MLAGVVNVLDSTQRQSGVDKVRICFDKLVPFEVFGHGDRAGAQVLHGVVSIVAFTFEDSSERIVRFLNLANDDGLELAA